MKNHEFFERIKVKDFEEEDQEGTQEERAKRIIRDYDRTLQNRTYKNTREAAQEICHIRENIYDKRTVVQASFFDYWVSNEKSRFMLEL